MDHPQPGTEITEYSSAAPQYSEPVAGSLPVDISDTLLRETAEAVSEASSALTSTLTCIQSFHSINAAPDVKFRKMREHVTECILVYQDLNLPLFSTVVNDLKTIVSLYEDMNEETFTTYIAEIAKEVSERAENAKKARKNDMRMVEKLNCQKEEAIMIIESLTLAHSEGLKAKQLLQQREPKQSEPQEGLGLLNKLSKFKPVRSPHAKHHRKEPAVVKEQQPDKVRLAIYLEEEALMALSAAHSIRDRLLPALQVFTASVQKVTKFFLKLEKEVCSFASQSVGSESNQIQNMSSHYAIMVKNSGSIIRSCNEYISAAPTVRAKIGDLSNVLRQEDQDNHIQKWMNETQQVAHSDHPQVLEHTPLQTQEHEPSEATLMSQPESEQHEQHPHEEPQQKSLPHEEPKSLPHDEPKSLPHEEPQQESLPHEEPQQESLPHEEPKSLPHEEPQQESLPHEEPKSLPHEEPQQESLPHEEPKSLPHEEPQQESLPHEEPKSLPHEEPQQESLPHQEPKKSLPQEEPQQESLPVQCFEGKDLKPSDQPSEFEMS